MQFPFDALGKLLLDAALDPLCVFTENPAVPLNTRFADAMTVPRSLPPELRASIAACVTRPSAVSVAARSHYHRAHA